MALRENDPARGIWLLIGEKIVTQPAPHSLNDECS